jgi:hypothetical protein
MQQALKKSQVLLILSTLLQVGCMQPERNIPRPADVAEKIMPGMELSEIKQIIRDNETVSEPIEWSRKPAYLIGNFNEWPERYRHMVENMLPELASKVSYMKDLTVPCGLFSYNEYFCFFDDQNKLLTMVVSEIR